PDGGERRTVALITTAANATVAPVHDRMPVFLDPPAFEAWLDPDLRDGRRLQHLLVPYDAGALTLTEVGDAVNQVRNDGPECHAPPVASEPVGNPDQPSLF